MSNAKVKIQIPLDKTLRDAIDVHARELGFSSVQDFTRVMYSAVLRDNMGFSLSGAEEQLSPAVEARYKKMLKEHEVDAKAGKVKTYTDVGSFLDDL
jgi:hypothetical protein